jgi:hypothetical protein
MDQKNGGERRANESGVKATFAAMALGSILAGLIVYLLQAQLGIPEDTARVVSTAFLLLGVADLVLLYFWDRIFKRRP